MKGSNFSTGLQMYGECDDMRSSSSVPQSSAPLRAQVIELPKWGGIVSVKDKNCDDMSPDNF